MPKLNNFDSSISSGPGAKTISYLALYFALSCEMRIEKKGHFLTTKFCEQKGKIKIYFLVIYFFVMCLILETAQLRFDFLTFSVLIPLFFN